MKNINYEKRILSKANNYFDNKEYDKALIHYNKILKLNPKCNLALNKKGHIYLNKKEFNKAVKTFDKALNTDSNLTEALLGKTEALFKLEQYSKALTTYNQAIESDEECVDIKFYNQLFELVEKQGNVKTFKSNKDY